MKTKINVLAIFCAVFIIGCGGAKEDLIGDWVSSENRDSFISIEPNADEYLVNINGKKHSATKNGEKLIVSEMRNGEILYDGKRDELILFNDPYIRFDSEWFEGHWKLVKGGYHPFTRKLLNNTLEIEIVEGSGFKVKFESELGGPIEWFECEYDSGTLVGDYYGGKKNAKIKWLSKDRISFTVDPFAEFEPIKGEIYGPPLPGE